MSRVIGKLKWELASRIRPWQADRNIGPWLKRFGDSYRAEHSEPITRPEQLRNHIEIIVTCYNHAAFLLEAFRSIEQQSWTQPITVTLADDSSTDETPTLIKKLIAQADPKRFQMRSFRSSSNLRQWGLINEVVKHSKNELFIILNDDDLLAPDCLEKLVAAFEQHPQVVLVGGSSTWFAQDVTPTISEPRPAANLLFVVSEPAKTHHYHKLNDLNMTHSSTAFFKSAWEAAGGYYPKDKRVHPAACEDRDFQMRVNALAPVGVYTDYPLAYWRTGSSHGSDF